MKAILKKVNTAKGDRPNGWCKVNIKQEFMSGPIKPNVDDCNLPLAC